MISVFEKGFFFQIDRMLNFAFSKKKQVFDSNDYELYDLSYFLSLILAFLHEKQKNTKSEGF